MLKATFAEYLREFGEGYDRYTFLSWFIGQMFDDDLARIGMVGVDGLVSFLEEQIESHRKWCRVHFKGERKLVRVTKRRAAMLQRWADDAEKYLAFRRAAGRSPAARRARAQRPKKAAPARQ